MKKIRFKGPAPRLIWDRSTVKPGDVLDVTDEQAAELLAPPRSVRWELVQPQKTKAAGTGGKE